MRGDGRRSRAPWPLLIVLLLFLSWTGPTARAEKVSEESSSRPPRQRPYRENNCDPPAASLRDVAHPWQSPLPPKPPRDPIRSLLVFDPAIAAHVSSNLRSSQDPDQVAQGELSASAYAPSSVGADGQPAAAAPPKPDPGGRGAEIETYKDRDDFGEILYPPPRLPPGPQWAPSVSIVPTELKFVETPLCQPTTHVIHVYNTDQRETFRILSLTTDAVYMQPVDFRSVEVPPGRGRQLKVVFLPRSLGGSHGSFRLLTSKGSIVISARGVGVESPYKLQPLVGAKVPSGVPFMWRLELFNPHSSTVKLVEALSSDHSISLGPPSVEDLESQNKFDEEDKAIMEKANNSGRGGVRSFPSTIWELPSKSSKVVLSVKLLAAHAGRHEGSIKLVLNRTKGETYDKNERHELHVPVQFDAAHGGVFRSPDQIDFGVATRRLDRLRQTVTLFNSGAEPVRVMDVSLRPTDPSLRVKYTKGYILQPYTEEPVIQLVYSGKLEGVRMGTLLIRTSNSNIPIEVPYRAKIQHGKLSWNEAEMSFLSPATGRKPFPAVSNTVRVLNNFRTPIAFHAVRVVTRPPRSNKNTEHTEAQAQIAPGDEKPSEMASALSTADDEEVCCFEVKDFTGGQVVSPGHPLAPFTIEYTPQDKNVIFTATLEIDTNLTTLEIPIEVHHGQLTCFDADQAEMRAKAAAEAAAMIAAAVVTKDAAGNAPRDSDPAAEDSGDAVPCAVLAEGKKAKVGDDISQMGLIDFGVVGVPAERYRRVAVYNPNPMPLTIKSVESSVRSVSVTRVEVSGSSLKTPISHVAPGSLLSTSHQTSHKPPPPPPRCMTAEGKNVACKQEFWSVQHKGGSGAVIIPPLHIATVHVLAAPEREETAPKGALTFYLDNGRQLIAPVAIKALKGTIGVSGMDTPVVELPPTFPGRPILAPLKLRNDFRDVVTVIGSRSTSPTFSLDLFARKLKPGRDTTAGQVAFDPAHLPRQYAYTSLGRVRRQPEAEKVTDKRRSMFAAMLGADVDDSRTKTKARTLYPDDVDELRRMTDAWRAVAADHGGHDDAGAGAFVTQTATVLLKTDAVDPFPIEVRSRLLRPSIFSVVEEEEEEPPKKTMDARFQYSTSKSKPKSKGEGQRVLNKDGVVDFGSVQLDRRSPRHRVIATNPLGNQVVCVRIMPFVAAAEKSIAEIEGDVDAATISAANLHVAGEYDPPGATGFVLEGGDISMKRKTGAGKGAAALVSDGRDTACLEPGESVDLGLLSFKPNEVRKYHAHMCVRNNFTTLECATLSGSADAVKVYVAKKPRGTQVVTDVGFRLARIGLGGADMLMQTVHVVNRGSVAVEVAKPYVGAFACGGDGSVGGYTVQPCKPFTLPPGGSKQLTVACLTDKAAQVTKYARGVAGAWTALTMEVSSPDGVKTTLTANLHASDGIVTGAYAAGEMARSGPRSLIAWLATICSGGAACWLFYANRAALQGAYERRKKAAAAAAAKRQEAVAAAVAAAAVATNGKKAKRRGSQDIGSPTSPGAIKSGSPKSPMVASSMDTESSSGSSPEKTESVLAKAPEPETSGLDSASGSSPALSPKISSSKLRDEKKPADRKSDKEKAEVEKKEAAKSSSKPSSPVSPAGKEKANGTESKIKSVPAPRTAPSTESGNGKVSPKTTVSPKTSPANSFKQPAEKTSDKAKVIPKPKGGAAPNPFKQPKQQQERLREEQPATSQVPRPEQLPTPNVTFAGKPIRTKASHGNEAGDDWITPPKPAAASPTHSEQSLLSPTGLAAEATATAAGLSVLSSPYGHDIFASAPSSMQQQQPPPPPPLPPGPPPSMQQQQPPLPPGPRPPNLRQDGTQQMTQQQPLGGFAAAGLPGLGSIGGGASGYNMWADHFSQLGQAAAKPSNLATPDDVRRLSESSSKAAGGSFFGGLASATASDALEPDGVGAGDGGGWGLWGSSHKPANSDLDDNEWEQKNLDLLNDLELD